jgi:hypothetical protein
MQNNKYIIYAKYANYAKINVQLATGLQVSRQQAACASRQTRRTSRTAAAARSWHADDTRTCVLPVPRALPAHPPFAQPEADPAGQAAVLPLTSPCPAIAACPASAAEKRPHHPSLSTTDVPAMYLVSRSDAVLEPLSASLSSPTSEAPSSSDESESPDSEV